MNTPSVGRVLLLLFSLFGLQHVMRARETSWSILYNVVYFDSMIIALISDRTRDCMYHYLFCRNVIVTRHAYTLSTASIIMYMLMRLHNITASAIRAPKWYTRWHRQLEAYTRVGTLVLTFSSLLIAVVHRSSTLPHICIFSLMEREVDWNETKPARHTNGGDIFGRDRRTLHCGLPGPLPRA
mgnify:CR=1 FL=1